MVTRRPHRVAASLMAGLMGVSLALAGCASSGSSTGQPSATAGTPSGTPGSPAALTPLTVGLGYIASVQFAQFYLAQEAGYYREAGLDVTFQNKIDPDLVTLVGQGNVDVGVADGTSVIPAASQGIPIRYITTIYAQDPNVVVTKSTSGIKTAADLKGRKLGIPGKYGSSWVMLQALLKAVGLTPDDLEIVLYPDFGQAVALREGAVDVSTGFANNEPIQLELSGVTPVVIRSDPASALPGPGLISSAATIDAKGPALRAFVAATLRAMKDIQADPEKGVDAAIAVVPALGQDRATQLKILEATAAIWESDYTKAHGLGAVDAETWARAITFMASIGLVANPVTVDQLVTSALLPG